MPDLHLMRGRKRYDRCRPLIDGRVRPEGIDLDITILKPREFFRSLPTGQLFHASELSLGSYASLVARDASPFIAIPVALSRIFRHSCIYVRDNAEIAKPAD